MTSALLPGNATPWERALADAMAVSAVAEDSIGAMRQVKYVSPRPVMLPYLVYEYGLGELTPYVPNLYDLINQGVRWQRIRGTVSAVAIGLAWIGYAATIEPAWTGRRWWNSFQLRFPDLPVADSPDLERIEGITGLSVPKRSQLRRGVHQYDVGAVEADHTALDGAMLDNESGIAITQAGTIWSFGRDHGFEHTLTEDEGRAIGNWLLQPGDVAADWDFANGAATADGEAVDMGSVLSVERASVGLALNTAGEWQEFAADEARITDRGLTIEPTSTNYIRNNTNQGQVGTGLPTNWALSPAGGLTAEVLAAGVKQGLPYTRVRFFGTATVNQCQLVFEPPAVIPASIGQVWAFSAYVELVEAAIAPAGFHLRFREMETGTVLKNIISNISPDATWSRYELVWQTTEPTINRLRPSFGLALVNGAAVDVTVDIAVQMELGDAVTSPILTYGTAETRAADSVSLLLPAGRHDLSFTFDDDAVEIVDDQSSAYPIPTDLYRPVLKSVEALVAGGGLVWAELEVLWVDADVLWADDPAEQRRSILAGWFVDKSAYMRLSSASGVIGYRRCRAVRPVAGQLGGVYALGTERYQPTAGAGALYVEAMTQFDDADGVECTALAIVVNAVLADGVAPGRAWLDPDELTDGDVIAAQDVSIPLRRTVREQVKILMRF